MLRYSSLKWLIYKRNVSYLVRYFNRFVISENFYMSMSECVTSGVILLQRFTRWNPPVLLTKTIIIWIVVGRSHFSAPRELNSWNRKMFPWLHRSPTQIFKSRRERPNDERCTTQNGGQNNRLRLKLRLGPAWRPHGPRVDPQRGAHFKAQALGPGGGSPRRSFCKWGPPRRVQKRVDNDCGPL